MQDSIAYSRGSDRWTQQKPKIFKEGVNAFVENATQLGNK